MDGESPLLSQTQKKILGIALGSLGVCAILGIIVFAIILFGWLVGFFAEVIWPLAVSGIIALTLRPSVDFLQRKLKVRRLFAVILLFWAFLMVVTAMILSILPPIIGQIIDLIDYLPALSNSVQDYIYQHYPEWADLVDRYMKNPTIHKFADGISGEFKNLLAHSLPTLKAAGAGILSVIKFFTAFALIPIYLFFFLLSSAEPTRSLPRHLSFLPHGARDDIIFLVEEFIAIVVSFFRGQFLIGVTMGIMLATGFTIIGLKFGLILGICLGFLNIVPYFGTITGLSTALPLAFIQNGGGWSLAGLVLLVFLCVQAIEAWFLTPRIMGKQTGLHPVVIITAIVFWGKAFSGILGMVLAIPLTAFFVTAWRLIRRKYLKPAKS